MQFEEKISFDDVLLRPQFSEIESRANVDTSVEIKGFKFSVPFVPANMKSIIGKVFLKAMFECKALAFMHRFCPLEEQVAVLQELKNECGDEVFNFIGVSIGIKEEDKSNLKIFQEMGVKIVCVDVAHLHSVKGLSMVVHIRKTHPEMLLVAGNVATAEGAREAWGAGADVVKVGVGSGSICSTRLEAAAGVPQLSAIMEIAKEKAEASKYMLHDLYLISDGGTRNSGDCVKALCFADMVMLGSYFAGSLETPSETIEVNGQKYKSYNGSSTHKDSRVEGVKAAVHSKGSAKTLMQGLIEGLQSGCSYQNAKNLKDLKENYNMIKISGASLVESRIHDVMINY